MAFGGAEILDAVEQPGVPARAHLTHPELVELPDALVVSLGDSALVVRNEATSLWQPDLPHTETLSKEDG